MFHKDLQNMDQSLDPQPELGTQSGSDQVSAYEMLTQAWSPPWSWTHACLFDFRRPCWLFV